MIPLEFIARILMGFSLISERTQGRHPEMQRGPSVADDLRCCKALRDMMGRVPVRLKIATRSLRRLEIAFFALGLDSLVPCHGLGVAPGDIIL